MGKRAGPLSSVFWTADLEKEDQPTLGGPRTRRTRRDSVKEEICNRQRCPKMGQTSIAAGAKAQAGWLLSSEAGPG